MSRRRTIGICGIADFRSSIGQNVLNGIYDAARDNDINVLNFCGAIKYSVSEDYELYHYYPSVFKYLNRQNIDGLVSWASSFSVFMSHQKISDRHRSLAPLPVVAIGVPAVAELPGVYTDVQASMNVALNHLVEREKHAKIAVIASDSRQHYMDRLNAIIAWYRNRGIEPDETLFFLTPSISPDDIALSMEKILAQGCHLPPLNLSSIVTMSDIAASQIIDILLDNGIRVPEDVAVVGFNNQFEGMSARIPVTTVDPLIYEKSYRAVEKLLDIICSPGDESLRSTEIFMPRLIIRQSSGSYEESIQAAAKDCASNSTAPQADSYGSTIELEEVYAESIMTGATDLGRDVAHLLARALVRDMEQPQKARLLSTIRRHYHISAVNPGSVITLWQNAVSSLRSTYRNHVADSSSHHEEIEDLFHQARVMISVFNSYYLTSRNYEAYAFNHIAQIAMDISVLSSGQQAVHLIERHIEGLGIPSFILILQDEISPSLGLGKVELAYPHRDSLNFEIPATHWRSTPGELPVKLIRSLHRGASSYVMKILYHREQYIGVVLLETGPRNIAIYDMLAVLLSRALYANYLRQNRDSRKGDARALLRTNAVRNILLAGKDLPSLQGNLNSSAVMEYLAERVHEKTDISAMAGDLGQSPSNLMKKTKALTGSTIQHLHELLKIERAKLLLERREAKVSEIAERLAFSNQSYFAKVFKKHTGQSPSEWMSRHSKQ